MQSEAAVERAVERYADSVRRICFYHLKNHADTEDVFQSVFLKYMLRNEPFESETHEKAWLLRVAINACRDHLRLRLRRPSVPPDSVADTLAQAETPRRELLSAVLSLPPKYKDALYLHYYEGYTAAQIGGILHRTENAVYSLLSRGRALLKEVWLNDEDE